MPRIGADPVLSGVRRESAPQPGQVHVQAVAGHRRPVRPNPAHTSSSRVTISPCRSARYRSSMYSIVGIRLSTPSTQIRVAAPSTRSRPRSIGSGRMLERPAAGGAGVQQPQHRLRREGAPDDGCRACGQRLRPQLRTPVIQADDHRGVGVDLPQRQQEIHRPERPRRAAHDHHRPERTGRSGPARRPGRGTSTSIACPTQACCRTSDSACPQASSTTSRSGARNRPARHASTGTRLRRRPSSPPGDSRVYTNSANLTFHLDAGGAEPSAAPGAPLARLAANQP